MNIQNFKANNTIYAKLPLGGLAKGGEAFVDTDNNYKLKLATVDTVDRESNVSVKKSTTEPLVALKLQDLKDFAKDNCAEGLLTKKDLGELPTLDFTQKRTVGSWHHPDKIEVTKEPNGKVLSDSFNDLTTLNIPDNLQWAIDPMVDDQWEAELYLFAPKTGDGGCGCSSDS